MKIDAELTKRENEVAELLAWGAAKKQVAGRLFISVRTVENTARNIYEKIEVRSAAALSAWWFCKKFKIPVSFNPAAMIALFFLVLTITYEIVSDDDMVGRTCKTMKVKVRKGRRRDDGSEENQC